jgi:hypothetical protein
MVDKIIGELENKIIEGEVKKGKEGIKTLEDAKAEIERKVQKITADLGDALSGIPEDYENRKDIEDCIKNAIGLIDEKWKEFQDKIAELITLANSSDLEKGSVGGGKDLVASYESGKQMLGEVAIKGEIDTIVKDIDKIAKGLTKGRNWASKYKKNKSKEGNIDDVKMIEENVGAIKSSVEKSKDSSELEIFKYKLGDYLQFIGKKNDIKNKAVDIQKSIKQLSGIFDSSELSECKKKARELENKSINVTMLKDDSDEILFKEVNQVKKEISELHNNLIENVKSSVISLQGEIMNYINNNNQINSKEELSELKKNNSNNPVQCLSAYTKYFARLKEEHPADEKLELEEGQESPVEKIIREGRERKATMEEEIKAEELEAGEKEDASISQKDIDDLMMPLAEIKKVEGNADLKSNNEKDGDVISQEDIDDLMKSPDEIKKPKEEVVGERGRYEEGLSQEEADELMSGLDGDAAAAGGNNKEFTENENDLEVEKKSARKEEKEGDEKNDNSEKDKKEGGLKNRKKDFEELYQEMEAINKDKVDDSVDGLDDKGVAPEEGDKDVSKAEKEYSDEQIEKDIDNAEDAIELSVVVKKICDSRGDLLMNSKKRSRKDIIDQIEKCFTGKNGESGKVEKYFEDYFKGNIYGELILKKIKSLKGIEDIEMTKEEKTKKQVEEIEAHVVEQEKRIEDRENEISQRSESSKLKETIKDDIDAYSDIINVLIDINEALKKYKEIFGEDDKGGIEKQIGTNVKKAEMYRKLIDKKVKEFNRGGETEQEKRDELIEKIKVKINEISEEKDKKAMEKRLSDRADGTMESLEQLLKKLEEFSGENSKSEEREMAEKIEDMTNMSDEEIFKKFFSYNDVLKKEEGEIQLPANGTKYIGSLRGLSKNKDFPRVVAKIRKDFDKAMKRLSLDPSIYGESQTWIYWDMAKQDFFNNNKDEADSKYEIDNPMKSENIQGQIANRHLGWEVYGRREELLDNLNKDDDSYGKILELLDKEAKEENSTLSSYDLALLGGYVKENLGQDEEEESNDESIKDVLDGLGVNVSIEDLDKSRKYECSLVEDEVKVSESVKEEMKNLLLEYGVIEKVDDEGSEEILGIFYDEIRQKMSEALDAEAQKEFSKWRYHKKTIAAGVGIGAVSAVASAGVRLFGGGIVSGAAIAGGTALGAGSGFLRGKIRKWLSPGIEKLKNNNSTKLKEVREKEAENVLTTDNVKLMMLQTLRAGIAKKVMNKKDFTEKDYANNVREFFKVNNFSSELSDAEKEKMISAVAIFAKISNENSKKLNDVIETKTGKLFDSETSKSTAIGGVIGGVTAAARSVSETALGATIASGAAGGLMGGALMSGRIEEMMKNKDIKKIIEEVSEIVSRGESVEEEVNSMDLEYLRTCLESGVLDKNSLVKEKVKNVLIENLLSVKENEDNPSDHNFEEGLKNRIAGSKIRKAKAWALGLGGGMALGGLGAYAANEAMDMLHDNNLLDMDAATASSKYGVDEKLLKASDINNDGEYSAAEVAIAQSKALELNEGDYLEKPVSGEQLDRLKEVRKYVDSRAIHEVATDGVVEEGEYAKLVEQKEAKEDILNRAEQSRVFLEDIDKQNKELGGLKAGKLLSAEEKISIKNYQRILGDNGKLTASVKDGLSGEEMNELNSDIHTAYEAKYGVNLEEKNIGSGEVYSPKEICDKQAELLGLNAGDVKQPLLADQLTSLDGHSTDVLRKVLEDGVINKGEIVELEVAENAPAVIKNWKGGDLMKKYTEIVGDGKEFKTGTVDAGGSISQALDSAVDGNLKMTVINPDGSEIDKFDVNLVHEGDTVIEKDGEIFVFKTSSVVVKEGDSLGKIYDNIDSSLDGADVPRDIRENFNIDKEKGGFHERINSAEAKSAKEFWDGLDEKHQKAWQGLSADHKQEILEKGEWVDQWKTSSPEEGVQEWTYIRSGDYDLRATAIDVDSDGTPDAVKVYCGDRQVGTEVTREENEEGDAFLERIKQLTDDAVERRDSELAELKIAFDKSLDDIKEVGINPFDSHLEEKVQFWVANSGSFDSPENTKDFFGLLDKHNINVDNEKMRFIKLDEIGSMEDRVLAVKLVDENGYNIGYDDAIKYQEQIASFENTDQIEGIVNLLNGEEIDGNIQKIFGVEPNVKHVYDADTKVHTLKDVPMGSGKEKVDILFSVDNAGTMKFGYDGPGFNNLGTKGVWGSIKPVESLTGENVRSLEDKLINKLARTRANMESHAGSRRER